MSSGRALRWFSLILLLSTGCAGTRAPVPSEPPRCSDAGPLELLAHDVALTVELTPPSLTGSGDVRVRARRETHVLALDAHGLRVSAVSAGGAPLPFRVEAERLCVALPRALAAGADVTLHVGWSVPVDRSTPHFLPDQVWAGYDAAAWMPTLQDPAQRATLRLRLTAPRALKAVASGRALGEALSDGATSTRTFVVDRPSPPFLFAFAVGRFDEAVLEVDGVTLRALGPPGADLDGALALTAPMLRFLRERTGAPFGGPEYTQVFVQGPAAQEAAGLAFLSADALENVRRDPTEDWIFSHELAHQWFAWRVPCHDFADFWLNEGFATFLVAAVKEQRWGESAYAREVELWRKRSARVHAEGHDAPVSLAPPGAPRPALRDAELQVRGVTYSRGALVLHRLRGELGDGVFWAGLQRYVADRSGRGAESEDLRGALEAVSGRDLRPFFARWVYAPAPDL